MKDDDDRVVDLQNAGEMAFIIGTLAATGSITSTCRRYKKLYGKSITPKRCQLIQYKYRTQIEAKREELNSEEGLKNCPPLNRRTRLEILWDVIESGLEERVVGSFKQKDEATGEDVVVPVIKRDLNSVLIAIRACKDEDHGWEELQLKKKKANKDEVADDEEYDVDDGVA